MKAHDGKLLSVNQYWVVVAYDEHFYVGQITTLQSEEKVTVNFLKKNKDGMHKWPRPKDYDQINCKYIFFSELSVQKDGTNYYCLSNENFFNQKYVQYKEKYIV